jgi:tyrosyl-tRNA synthetase
LAANKPIYLHGYVPLMQGYDSAHMAVDLEIGGNDKCLTCLSAAP